MCLYVKNSNQRNSRRQSAVSKKRGRSVTLASLLIANTLITESERSERPDNYGRFYNYLDTLKRRGYKPRQRRRGVVFLRCLLIFRIHHNNEVIKNAEYAISET